MESYADNNRLGPVPLDRIRQKTDALMAKRDTTGAERVLLYWLSEALAARDGRGELALRGELIGHYRKTGDREKALAQIGPALSLIGALGLEGTVTSGTARINAATALSAFGENARALKQFEAARADYENGGGVSPALRGGLYNNMGLCYAALARFGEARDCFDRAMEQMAQAPHGALEQAVTCLNRADALSAEMGPEAAEAQINALLEQAETLLDTPDLPRDGYYAFVCEKCAPVFDYYGCFLTAQALRERAEEIHDRA